MKRMLLLFVVLLATLFTLDKLQAYLLISESEGWPLPPGSDPHDPIVVEYYINEDGGGPSCVYGDEFIAVQKGLQAWTDISTSKIAFKYDGTTERMPDRGKDGRDNFNVIGWILSGWTNYGFGPRVPAFEERMLYYEGGPVKSADMFFNGEYQSWSAKPENSCPSGFYDVQNVAAHETGHWVGLHNLVGEEYNDRTMGASWTTDVSKRTLHSDDIAGASFLYPYDATWPQDLASIHTDQEHTLNVDVALAWNPEEAEECFHLACQEGYQFEGLDDTVIPFDAPVSPVRVVYGKQTTTGWVKSNILSDYHQRIYGPQLEISNNIVRI